MGKSKITEEEIQNFLAEKDLKLLNTYDGQYSNLEIECKCGNKYTTTWKYLKRGSGGCSKCSIEKRKTPFEETLDLINEKGYKYISGKYENNTSELIVECEKGHQFNTNRHKLRTCGCQKCSGNIKKTIDEVRRIGISKGLNLLSEEYISVVNNLDWICSDGHHITKSLNRIMNSTGCPECSPGGGGWNKKKHESVIKEMEIGGHVYVSGFYENNRSKLDFICPTSHKYQTTWQLFQRGVRCPECSWDKFKHPIAFVKEYLQKYGYELISCEENFVESNTDLYIRCDEGHETTRKWKYLWHLKRFCDKCVINKPERELLGLLKTFDDGVIYKDRKILSGKELDFYLPKYGIAVEYCGLYWHSELFRDSKYHRNKLLCSDQAGVKLITIFENEWHCKKRIIESIISSKIGRCAKEYARKGVIKEIEYDEAKTFLNDNHLMGYSSSRAIGLYFDERLLCAFTYKVHDGVLEVVRFCNKCNHIVIGGFSKLLLYTMQMESVRKAVSFVDLRYYSGKSLLSSGFKLESVTQGWCWTDFTKIYNRLQCRSNMDERNLSQEEYAKELKWFKIYDCGQAKFSLTLEQ